MIGLWLSVALGQTVTVQTARIDLPVGHVLRTDDVRAVTLPERDLPRGMIADAGDVVGRTVKVPLFAGEAMRGEYLGPAQTVPASLIPEGAWLVPVDVRTQSEHTDVVQMYSGGFCTLAREVTVVLGDAGLVAVPARDVARVVGALGPDTSVRRADPGLRDCR
jgi:hypothetical protein